MSFAVPPSSSYIVPIFAILVGIDTYSAPFSPLNKAVGDVNKLKGLLMHHPQIKLKEKDIKILTNENATRENIIKALSILPKGLPRNTSVLFYFSGYSGSANDSGVLCPVDSFERDVGTISDKTLIRLFESMSLSLSGNITVFLDCFSKVFEWENPSSFVVISPEKATETVDGGAFTNSLVEVLKKEEHLDGLTNQSLVDKIRAAMGANIYCHGQQANHVVFNPRSESYHLFLRGRTEPGKIVIDAGFAHGIRTGTIFGVYAYSIQGNWNRLLGRLVVESIHDTQANVKFQRGKLFVLPPVFFAVELDSELDTINAYILGGTENLNELKSIQSVPGLKIVDSQKDAEISLKFGRDNGQDVFHATWNGIKNDKECKRITTVTTTDLSSPNYSPIWLPLEDLRIHARNFARFKYHIGRSIPHTGFSTLNLECKLHECGQGNEAKVHNLQDNFLHVQLKEHEMRGPFYITLRNPNRFPLWPHVFICLGDHHVIHDWYESKLDSPLEPLNKKTITVPRDENDGLYFSWDPIRPTDLLYIKIFATKEYSSFSSMKERFWPGDEVDLRELDKIKSNVLEAPEVVVPDKMTVMRGSATANLVAKKFHWAETRLTIKVDFAPQDKVHHEDKGYKGGERRQ